MNSTENQIRELLPTKNILQLATARDDQPWACNIHYYSDQDLNLYWISDPDRRHSLEIKDNPKVSAVLKIHENTAQENYVIGIACEGTAELMTDFDEAVAQAYCDKHDKGPAFVEDMRLGRKSFKFYKLTPTKFVLFNTKDIQGDPRQEWVVGS